MQMKNMLLKLHVKMVTKTLQYGYMNYQQKIDIHVNSEAIFKAILAKRFKDIAEWLYDLSKIENSKINIHIDNEYVFKHA